MMRFGALHSRASTHSTKAINPRRSHSRMPSLAAGKTVCSTSRRGVLASIVFLRFRSSGVERYSAGIGVSVCSTSILLLTTVRRSFCTEIGISAPFAQPWADRVETPRNSAPAAWVIPRDSKARRNSFFDMVRMLPFLRGWSALPILRYRCVHARASRISVFRLNVGQPTENRDEMALMVRERLAEDRTQHFAGRAVGNVEVAGRLFQTGAAGERLRQPGFAGRQRKDLSQRTSRRHRQVVELVRALPAGATGECLRFRFIEVHRRGPLVVPMVRPLESRITVRPPLSVVAVDVVRPLASRNVVTFPDVVAVPIERPEAS